MTEGLATARERNSHIFERQAEDWYCEPAWIWQQLFRRACFTSELTVLDPCCGLGTCVEAAAAEGMSALGSDIEPRWQATPDRQGLYWVSDFLAPEHAPGGWPVRHDDGWEFPDLICGNPPFKRAREFVERALRRARSSVCFVLPAKWILGAARSKWLQTTPLQRVLFLCPRPSMLPGHLVVAGEKPAAGTVDFALYWWLRGYDGEPQIGWLHRDEVAA